MLFATASGAGKDGKGKTVKAATRLFDWSDRSKPPRIVFETTETPFPSFLAFAAGSGLLAVTSEGEGEDQISALHIAGDKLELTGRRKTGGNGAVHAVADHGGRWLAVANYRGNAAGQDLSIAVYPIQAEGKLGEMTASAKHEGSGPNKKRQAGPHTHCVAFSPDDRLLAAIDLGTDGVWLYHFDAATGGLRLASEAKMPAGSGPRHCVFHPREPLLYVCGELDSTLVTFRYDVEAGTAAIVDTDAATAVKGKGGANNHKGKNINYPSGLAISPDGRYLMLGNRGSETVAVFWIDPATGMAKLREEVSCGGIFPRAIRLDKTGRVLAVANYKSGNVTLFARDFESSKLTPLPHGDLALPSAMDVIFLD